MVSLYNKQSQFYFGLRDVDRLEIDETATLQLPAAFRFRVNNRRIDALPETPEAIDQTVAEDLLDELRSKVDAFLVRLETTNTEKHVKTTGERLFKAINVEFQLIRPGVVLSRLRSLEAIREAFDTPEGREAVFPDFAAMIGDLCLSGQDLLAIFPIVRQIERERLAITFERSPAVMDTLQTESNAVTKFAQKSDVVSEAAIEALAENEPAIVSAVDEKERAELLADKLLILRNFVSESVRAISHKSTNAAKDSWEIIKPDFQEGAKNAARILPPLAVIALLTSIAGPVAGLAGILKGDVFKSVSSALSKITAMHRSYSSVGKDKPSDEGD